MTMWWVGLLTPFTLIVLLEGGGIKRSPAGWILADTVMVVKRLV